MLDSYVCAMYSTNMKKILSAMDTRTRACLLLDFYGQLLTERAREALELHFAEDMSLAEIAEEMGTSRQAVHDRIRRALAALDLYESKLALASRFYRHRQRTAHALALLDAGDLEAAKAQLTQLVAEL